jgi:hypothetical protein
MTLVEHPAAVPAPDAPTTANASKASSTPDGGRGKRVRVQAFQEVSDRQLKIQRVASAPEPSGRLMATRSSASAPAFTVRQPMTSSSLHNSLAGSMQLTAHPTTAIKAACASQAPALAAAGGGEAQVAQALKAAIAVAASATEQAAPQKEQAAVCHWVYKLATTNPKTVEILMTREVLCLDLFSQDLPSCSELRAITHFDWSDLEAVLAE